LIILLKTILIDTLILSIQNYALTSIPIIIPLISLLHFHKETSFKNYYCKSS